jgi:FkbM family methyltransferase
MYLKFRDIVKHFNFNVKGVIHVGGHIGEEIPDYLEYTNNIHIFEPIKECFDQIPNIANKYNCALGDIEGNFLLNVANNNQSSSLLNPKKHLEQHPEVLFTHQMRVPVKLLDSFEIKSCNFLNMDVQGYELYVLNGAVDTLKYIDMVYTEINMDEIYEGNCLVYDLDNFLSEYSFKRVWYFDTGHKWGDALYVRS